MKELVKRLLGSRWVKIAVAVLAVAGFTYTIVKEWNDVHRSLGDIGWLTCLWALLALLGMQFAALKVWQVLLAGLGSPRSLRVTGRILMIGQLGKYIPGSLWPILAQMELGARAKVPRARSASVGVLAMIVSLIVGLLVAMVTLPFAQHNIQYLWVFLLVPAIGICLYPRFLNPLLNKLFTLARRPPLETPVTGRLLIHALSWSLVAWLCNGLQCWLLIEKFGAPAGKTILLALGGYAFAWCAGFVVVVAPAGAGVREALLVAFLSPLIGSGPALAVALVSRAVNTVSDLLVAGVAWLSSRRELQEAEADGEADRDREIIQMEATRGDAAPRP